LLARWQSHDDREALGEPLGIEVERLKARIRSGSLRPTDGDASVSGVAQETVMRMLRLDERPVCKTPQAMRAYLWAAAWRLLAECLRQRGESGTLPPPRQVGLTDALRAVIRP